MNSFEKHPMLENILSTVSGISNNVYFQLRPLDQQRDLPTIYDWVNQPYAIHFWGMNGDFEQLASAFATMQASNDTLSMAGYLNNSLICQLDLYDPFTDPVGQCYPVNKGDLGIHLLMAPGKKPVRNFTPKVLYHILSYLFQSPLVQRVIGEPDQQNEAANQLLHKLDFEFHCPIQLPDKQANFYTISKVQFDCLPAASFAL